MVAPTPAEYFKYLCQICRQSGVHFKPRTVRPVHDSGSSLRISVIYTIHTITCPAARIHWRTDNCKSLYMIYDIINVYDIHIYSTQSWALLIYGVSHYNHYSESRSAAHRRGTTHKKGNWEKKSGPSTCGAPRSAAYINVPRMHPKIGH